VLRSRSARKARASRPNRDPVAYLCADAGRARHRRFVAYRPTNAEPREQRCVRLSRKLHVTAPKPATSSALRPSATREALQADSVPCTNFWTSIERPDHADAAGALVYEDLRCRGGIARFVEPRHSRRVRVDSEPR